MRSSAYHIKVSVQDQLLYSKTQPTSSSFEGPTRPSQVSLEFQNLHMHLNASEGSCDISVKCGSIEYELACPGEIFQIQLLDWHVLSRSDRTSSCEAVDFLFPSNCRVLSNKVLGHELRSVHTLFVLQTGNPLFNWFSLSFCLPQSVSCCWRYMALEDFTQGLSVKRRADAS